MKALRIIATAIVGFVAAPTAANAYVQAPVSAPAIELVSHADVIQRWDDRRDRRWDGRRGGRWDDRRGRRYDRRNWNRGRHRGWNNNRARWRNACHMQWRGNHRERVCRRVRY